MLRRKYDSQEEIPQEYHELYSEVDGAFVFTGLEEDEDTKRVKGALEQERKMHAKTREKLRENQKKAEMDIKKGQSDEPDSMARERISQLEDKIRNYEKLNRKRAISDSVLSAATKAKVLDVAKQDIDIIAQSLFEMDDDNGIVTGQAAGKYRGMTPDEWFSAMKTERTHWWGQSQGGGATGDTGLSRTFVNDPATNPWLKENWNVFEQAKILQKDRETARKLAKKAGKSIDR